MRRDPDGVGAVHVLESGMVPAASGPVDDAAGAVLTKVGCQRATQSPVPPCDGGGRGSGRVGSGRVGSALLLGRSPGP